MIPREVIEIKGELIWFEPILREIKLNELRENAKQSIMMSKSAFQNTQKRTNAITQQLDQINDKKIG